ncbi:probable 2-oxoglutarate dehydrogenase E1 component DHKTD1 homolog, mitochondrial isoform X1 [Drosophila albomicans]|uniref:Probable 2-oxoglutarate dehydrogenase E1 component DHKTD1 homolog, mitochondrial isoform X1 n=1 Tax=Drosophila albomicans TaxID=7291 RepID=A0A6P8XA41_DROAB|nr:probable 2-oxoglutarate dehydrogenase E1 component DHKTD1 homolog, mitochondrial isoform X1 [Drosophila albomicans]
MLRHFVSSEGKFAGLVGTQTRPHRSYHSKKGVWGYRPVAKRVFEVAEEAKLARNSQGNVYRWVEAFRQHGHKLAAVNPISIKEPNSESSELQELNPAFYGLQTQQAVRTANLLSAPAASSGGSQNVQNVAQLEQLLRDIYCGSAASAEFAYIEDTEEREWLARNFETLNEHQLQSTERCEIAELLIKSQAWDNFMALKFPTVKRYSGEGAESMLAFFWQLLRDSVQANIEHVVLAMPHRGRTSLQAAMFNMRPAKVFRKLSGTSEFADNIEAMSDVITHFHVSEQLQVLGKSINFSMIRNPSHLEAANPVAMGKTRSKQQTRGEGAFDNAATAQPFGQHVVNVILHGDAAFAGQGINQECLNMAYVPHFEVGGSVHLIVNNQVGFTTPADRGRSSAYSSDLAKSIQAPVFHVNGDDPEAVARITNLAFRYQREFRKDIFIDMNCFRRWGHNEVDDPTFTNPLIYKIIHQRQSVPDLYADKLATEGVLSKDEAKQLREKYMAHLGEELALAPTYVPPPSFFEKQWAGLTSAPANELTYWDTGLDYGLLHWIGQQSVAYPEDFSVHPHLLKTHIQGRLKKLEAGNKIDWATAEALAIGSLMYQGHNVRISGEDVGRGTFSHRHAMLVDQKTNEMYIPLNHIEGGNGGKLELAHSILSEEAVLAFEYGMAIDNPQNLIIWEAQFGDFANGAQIIIDTFIVSGETKWMDSNALVMLLPHGYDGVASEHSSCRIERFLQLCDSKETSPDGDGVNVHVVNPTTPAQYYHVLRRQLARNFRKPLVVIAPKTLLRLSAATSTHEDFQPGSMFHNVLGDNTVQPEQVRKVILCSGKHYYNLVEERQKREAHDTAIVRLESLCPFPVQELQAQLAQYGNVQSFIWSQEEHRNMGAWTFVRPRFENLIGQQLKYCGRSEAPTPATGIGKVHKQEAAEVVAAPFEV